MTKKERKIYNRKWYLKNKKTRIVQIKKYQQINRKKLSKKQKEYQKLNAKKISEQKKKYYLKYKIKILKRCKKYQKNNIDKIKEYYEKNKKVKLLQMKIYRNNHKKQMNQYKRNKYHTDINYRLRCYLKNRMYEALKGKSKFKHTLKLLGCSLEFLKQYLEKQFTKGMSWSNYGKWHIDHIRPCASFNLSKESEQKKCFHYTNLQPLWEKENLSKGRKLYKIGE